MLSVLYMLSVTYVLSVTNKPFMLSVVMLNVVMLSVVVPIFILKILFTFVPKQATLLRMSIVIRLPFQLI